MASKSVYQDFDQTVLKHYGLDSASVYGVLSSTMDSIDPVLCIQDPDLYDNIKTVLSNETLNTTWRSYKRAFILPKCPVSLDRVKSIAKERNIVIVNDYEKADFIISHDSFHERFESSDNIKSTCLLAKLWNYNLVSDTQGRLPIVDNSKMLCIYDNKWSQHVSSWNCTTNCLYDTWLITGMALDIAYRLETGAINGVLDVNTLMHAATSTQEITEEMIELIARMIQSYNDEDHEIVAKLLPTIDRTKNHYLLWKLFQDASKITWKFKRNKDVQYWLNNLEYDYENYSAEKMILKLEKKGQLDNKSFRFLEPICRKEIQIYNRDLYVFQVSVKPKYQEYLK